MTAAINALCWAALFLIVALCDLLNLDMSNA